VGQTEVLEVLTRQRVAALSGSKPSLELLLKHILDQAGRNLPKNRGPGISSGKLQKKTPSREIFSGRGWKSYTSRIVNLTRQS
jgi:hypothetical protein